MTRWPHRLSLPTGILRLNNANPQILHMPKEIVSMNKSSLITACLLALIALFTIHQTALAHESITVGDYEIEIGWVNEPPIVGQQNAIVVNVSDTSRGDAQPVEDVSSLTVTVSYGDQSRKLTLQPLGEDTPGQFDGSYSSHRPGAIYDHLWRSIGRYRCGWTRGT